MTPDQKTKELVIQIMEYLLGKQTGGVLYAEAIDDTIIARLSVTMRMEHAETIPSIRLSGLSLDDNDKRVIRAILAYLREEDTSAFEYVMPAVNGAMLHIHVELKEIHTDP